MLAPALRPVLASSTWRESAEHVVVVERCNPQLAQMVRALSPSRGFSRGLDRREQKGNENAEDGNDHQQFHERETFEPRPAHDWSLPLRKNVPRLRRIRPLPHRQRSLDPFNIRAFRENARVREDAAGEMPSRGIASHPPSISVVNRTLYFPWDMTLGEDAGARRTSAIAVTQWGLRYRR